MFTTIYCQKLLAFAPTNRQFVEKNRLSGNTDFDPNKFREYFNCKSYTMPASIWVQVVFNN